MTPEQRDKGLGDWIGQAVDRTATTVEEIHRTIAEIPLDLMRQSGYFEKTAEDVGDLQERSIGLAYDLVRDVNHRVTGFLSDLLSPASADPDLEAR